MTVLALRLSAYTNGGRAAPREGVAPDVEEDLAGGPRAECPSPRSPTGHIHSWLSDEFARLYDRYLGPRWLDEPLNQRIWERVGEIPDSELWRAKERLRERLVTYARARLRAQLERFGTTG